MFFKIYLTKKYINVNENGLRQNSFFVTIWWWCIVRLGMLERSKENMFWQLLSF